MEQLSAQYWEERYENQNTGWDLGEISTPLKTYIDQLTDKSIKILIPGGGNSYEAEYLFKNGFKNVYVVDVSKTALISFKKRVPEFPLEQLWHQDFFDLNVKYTFDVILEQTFFCAINPRLRIDYISKILSLLKLEGKLVGVLFNEQMNADQPPFLADREEYLNLFKDDFKIEIMERCYNSTGKRMGKEWFIKLIKK